MPHMVRMGLRPASLALAAALCLGSSAQAASDPLLAQTSLTLNGLSFQLIDLTPDDGIAPSLNFQTQVFIDISRQGAGDMTPDYLGQPYQNSLLPPPQAYISADGMGSLTSTADSVTLQSQLPLSQLLPQPSPTDEAGTVDRVTRDAFQDMDMFVADGVHKFADGNQGSIGAYGLPFTLGAGTGLVLQGTASTHLTFDGSALRTELDAYGYEFWNLNAKLDADVMFSMSDIDGMDLPNMLWFSKASSMKFDQDSMNDTLSATKSQSFKFSLLNPHDTEMAGSVLLSLGIGSHLTLDASRTEITDPPIDIPAIPEPSTYALMGLGLVGIAAVARRRRHVS